MPDEADPLDWLADDRRQRRGSRVDFQAQLRASDEHLVATGELVAGMILPVTQAFLEGDAHGAGEATAAIEDVNERCVTLEETCYVLIARQSPVAGDLRHLVALLRSIPDVQRSAMLLGHVASSLTWVHPPALPEEARQLIAQLGAVASEIFAGGVAAWRHHDALAATELDEADDQVDLLQKVLLTEIYTGRQSVEEAVSLALLARYYERVADHGVEMARQVAYYRTGERIQPFRR